MISPEASPKSVEASVEDGEVTPAQISELYFGLIDLFQDGDEAKTGLNSAEQNVVIPVRIDFPEELVEQSPFEQITAYYYPKPWENDELAALGGLRVSCENKSLMPNNLVSVTEIELMPDLASGQITGQFVKFEVEADGQIKDYKFRPLKQQTVTMLREISEKILN